MRPEDLWELPLITSHQKGDDHRLAQWMGREFSELHVVATYNLVFNASLLVDEGLGYALCLDKLIHTEGTGLCFRPFLSASGGAVPHRLEKISDLFQGGGAVPSDRAGEDLGWNEWIVMSVLALNSPGQPGACGFLSAQRKRDICSRQMSLFLGSRRRRFLRPGVSRSGFTCSIHKTAPASPPPGPGWRCPGG